MASESNRQDQSTGFVGFLVRNQVAVIVVALIILFGGYFLVTRNDDDATTDDQTTTTQQPGQNSQDGQSNQNQNGQTGDQTGNNQGQQPVVGNVSATGTLLASDNAAKGNLMVDSQSGKIYISTKRDFSSLVGKSVTLQADGTLNSFRFLGFAEQTVTTPTQGGATAGNFVTTGTLRASDNLAKGNYMVVSGANKIFVKSAHDYASLVGQEVNLTAMGTINSFTGAVITKK